MKVSVGAVVGAITATVTTLLLVKQCSKLRSALQGMKQQEPRDVTTSHHVTTPRDVTSRQTDAASQDPFYSTIAENTSGSGKHEQVYRMESAYEELVLEHQPKIREPRVGLFSFLNFIIKQFMFAPSQS